MEQPINNENELVSKLVSAVLRAVHAATGKQMLAAYLNRDNAAVYLGHSPAYVDTLTRLGMPVITIGNHRMYSKTSIDAWLKTHEL